MSVLSDPSTWPNLVPVISVATALVAIIASSLVTCRQMRLNIGISVSSKRQIWIDKLRRDVADALALASRIEELKRLNPNLNPEKKTEVSDWKKEIELEKAELKTVKILIRIKLQLNPNEWEHNNLVCAFQKLINVAQVPQPEETDVDKQGPSTEFCTKRDDVLRIAQTILKSEWNRVRKGE